jgi:hypothetical protein
MKSILFICLLLILNNSFSSCENNETVSQTTIAVHYAESLNETQSPSAIDQNKLIITPVSSNGSIIPKTTSTWLLISAVCVFLFIAVLVCGILIYRKTLKRLHLINRKNDENVEKLTNEGVDEVDCKNIAGHENGAISVSESTDAIRIESEINNAIKEINENSNSEPESRKLLDKAGEEVHKQLEVVDVINSVEEGTNKKSKLNIDIEKQPLNQE